MVSYVECNEPVTFLIAQQIANLGGHKVRWSDLLRKFFTMLYLGLYLILTLQHCLLRYKVVQI